MVIHRHVQNLFHLSGKIGRIANIAQLKEKIDKIKSLKDHVEKLINALRSKAAPRKLGKPMASEVLSYYLKQSSEPPWTSYFVKYKDVKDDQWGKSHFNWKVGNSNYHILRAGCYPYIKYHCTKRKEQDLSFEDSLFRFMKILNLGIPLLAYGMAATQLITHTEIVNTSKGPVNIYFLYKENEGSQY